MLADVLRRIPDMEVWRCFKTPYESKTERVAPLLVPLPDACLEYLRANRIPEDIIRDLEASSYGGWIGLGPLTVMPMSEMIEQTTGILPCIENGYLTLAGGANGDPVCLHRDSRRMVFVSHDTLWSDDWKDFIECVQETPYSYDEFWDKVLESPNFPCDYYEAQELWQ